MHFLLTPLSAFGNGYFVNLIKFPLLLKLYPYFFVESLKEMLHFHFYHFSHCYHSLNCNGKNDSHAIEKACPDSRVTSFWSPARHPLLGKRLSLSPCLHTLLLFLAFSHLLWRLWHYEHTETSELARFLAPNMRCSCWRGAKCCRKARDVLVRGCYKKL